MAGYWWCSHCHEEIGAYHVTYDEKHTTCGHPVEWIEPGTTLDSMRSRISTLESDNSTLRGRLATTRKVVHDAINNACICGGQGPGDCCPACDVWHEAKGVLEGEDNG